MMTDSHILDVVLGKLKLIAVDGMPLSPKRAALMIEQVGALRGKRAESDAPPGTPIGAGTEPYFQSFWKCEHYPSAINNWKSRESCEYGCEKSELRWYSNGCSPATS